MKMHIRARRVIAAPESGSPRQGGGNAVHVPDPLPEECSWALSWLGLTSLPSVILRARLRNLAAGVCLCIATLGTGLASGASAATSTVGPAASAVVGSAELGVVSRWLATPAMRDARVGLIALPLGGGPALLEHQSALPLNPASTIKLLTSHAALSMLGPDFRWQTGAYLNGELRDGVLHGDLVLRGGGDPKLVIEDLQRFIAAMRAAGLQELRGDLIIDDSVFEVGEASVEAFDGDPTQPYNVRPFGLLMNFKATRVVVHPGDGRVAQISLDPALDGVAIENRLKLRDGHCRRGQDVLSVSEPATGPGGKGAGQPSEVPRLIVSGSYSPACGEIGAFVSVLSHRAFIDALFRASWREAGGRWHGRTRVVRGAARDEPWLRWESPRTLADVVRDINKFSNNVMSRQLLLQLGHEAGARPADVNAARNALRDWLERQNLKLSGLVVDNGSGLSRSARISASDMAQVLAHAAHSRHSELLRDTLPVLGIDGTMRYRMAGEPLAGRGWIKTGSLADVRTIAGYLDAKSGLRYVVVLFYNGPQPGEARRLQDDFLRWVYRNG
jgi:D-alanyl-D-alanine carboxypeptidase/D-alanyl-D-alanine-endopeptidase (penicillin-binding protein 4)